MSTAQKGPSTELYVWGNNTMGQLGLGHQDTEEANKLKTLKTCSFNIHITSVACGEDSTFLVTKQGLIYGMGSNQHGKLGLDVSVESCKVPKLIESVSQHKISAVACGLNHTLAVTADAGVVYSWGSGVYG